VRAPPAPSPEGREGYGGGLDGEAPPRQATEELGELAVHPFGDPGGTHEQFLWSLGVEPRIGAQKSLERLKIAFEPGGGHGGPHLPINARNFPQAQGVDGAGIEVERRVLPNQALIVCLAIR
jgi:hypothetical protein